MKKQLSICLIQIIVSLFLLVSFISISYGADAAKAQGEAIARDVRSKINNPDKLKERLLNPMLGSGTMKTFDNQKEFTPQVACPSSKAFLKVIVQPTGTGDLNLVIQYDSNYDGIADKTVSASPVSGLCVNGFISCDPGTWNNCKGMRFYLQGDGNLIVGEEYLNKLQGCFCVNNTCGGQSIVVNNAEFVVKTAGSAVINAFTSLPNSVYAISNAKVEGLSILYYGQKTSSCSVINTGAGTENPSIYYSPITDAYLRQDAESLALMQSQDPDSIYYKIKTSGALDNSISKECSVEKVVIGCSVIEQGNCTGVENCSLVDEIWDGVPIIRAGVRTGLNPLGGCLNVCGSVQCFPWIRKVLRYLCPVNAAIEDPSPRLSKVEATTRWDRGEGIIHYDDLMKQRGNWELYPDKQIVIGRGDPVSECENVCKVKVLRLNTQVAQSNILNQTTGQYDPFVAKSYLVNPDKEAYFYKRCEENVDGYSYCPVESNEVLVEDCRCRNDFNHAVLMMQVLRMAGQDIICSSGQKQVVSGVEGTKTTLGFPSLGIPGGTLTGEYYVP